MEYIDSDLWLDLDLDQFKNQVRTEEDYSLSNEVNNFNENGIISENNLNYSYLLADCYSDNNFDVPLMNNGSNFLPQLAAAHAAAAAAANQQQHSSGPQIPPPPNISSSASAAVILSHLNAALNESQQSKSNSENSLEKTNCSMQQGAGPMDLENDNDLMMQTTNSIAAEINKRLAKRENKNSNNLDDDTLNIDSGTNSLSANKQLLMTNEMFLNGLMAAPHPFHPMMLQTGVLMDPQTMAASLQQMQQQFPIMPNRTSTQSICNQPNSSNDQPPMKELITCRSCTLYPPNPNAPPPTIRERPQGCRTVFVGGLPENITEEIIREIFESCGEITTLRLSKKNFCHIRFVFEASVDSAIYLSGYRIRIANSSDPNNCGRLHVDYAQARDDQYEWECKQRQLQREQRHRERLERDKLRSQSPQPIHYTEHEAVNIAEKLKSDETFSKAVQTLITWLERGDCAKKNSNQFYTMIQSTNAHVRRLQNDRNEHEEELKKSREIYRKKMLMISQQFNLIEKVFSAALKKKVWDHFTKAQRKNIDQWKKVSLEMRSIQIEDDEMDMSDEDRDYRTPSNKRIRHDTDNLKEENDSLRCQLEAYKNEVNLVKSDQKSDSDLREKQIKVLQETIRNLQTQLLENKHKENEFNSKIADLEEKLKQANVKELLLKTKIANTRNIINNKVIENSEDSNDKNNYAKIESCSAQQQQADDKLNIDSTLANADDAKEKALNTKSKTDSINLDDARIISLVSTFLVVHPFGASPDYICSYLQKSHPNLRSRDLEEILSRYHTIFREEISGIGMKIERKWKFCGFEQSTIEKDENENKV